MEKYIISKLDGKNYCVKNGQFLRHLNKYNITMQMYHECFILDKIPTCKYCFKKASWDDNSRKHRPTCGDKACCDKAVQEAHLNRKQEDIVVSAEKRKKTVIEKYGVEYITQERNFIQKIKESNNKIVSPDGKSSKQIQQEKTRKTKQEKYGNEFYNNSEAIKTAISQQTPEKKEEILETRRKTNIERFGVENCFVHFNAKYTARGNAKLKEFIFPSGRKIMIQGHEHKVINKLLEKYPENELIVSDASKMSKCNAPIISYISSKNTLSKYYPDILIISENKIIEVKSSWWFDGNGGEKYKDRLDNNMRKRQAALDAGYQFEFWIYKKNGKILEIIK